MLGVFHLSPTRHNSSRALESRRYDIMQLSWVVAGAPLQLCKGRCKVDPCQEQLAHTSRYRGWSWIKLKPYCRCTCIGAAHVIFRYSKCYTATTLAYVLKHGGEINIIIFIFSGVSIWKKKTPSYTKWVIILCRRTLSLYSRQVQMLFKNHIV